MCSKKEISVLIGVEADEELGGAHLHIEEVVEEEEADEINISLNSVVGITNPKTMKLLGKVGGHELIVMIDPGATIISFPIVQFNYWEFSVKIVKISVCYSAMEKL